MAGLSGAARQHLIDNSGEISKLAYKVTVWILFAFAICCTIARGVIRVATKRRPSADDYFVVLAMVALAATWAVLLKMLDGLYLTEALNDHSSEITLTLAEIPVLLGISKWSKIFVAMAWTSIFAIKGAFLCFFHVLIRQLSGRLNIYFWFIVFFCTASWITLSFIDWATCPYVGEKAAWCAAHFNHRVSLAVNIVSPILDITCDLMIISIPLLVLSRSLMSAGQKFSYAGFLCLSIGMVIVALIRLIGTLATTKEANRGSSPIWGTFWEMIEACIAVMMACFLTFRAALLKLAKSEDPAAHLHRLQRGSDSLWDRILSTLHFRSRYRRTPSVTGEEGATGSGRHNGAVSGRNDNANHLIPTVNITRPTLAFSRLRTLLGRPERTHIASESSLVTRGTINVDTEFDLRELDYHEMRRQEAPPSSGSGAMRPQGRGWEGQSFRS